MAHLLLSAAHKSSGKTTITLGLCAALRERGLVVQSFKKGPDYIDPMWLGKASGRACHNLDFYTQDDDEIRENFARYHNNADISLIEGNKGLHDGIDLEGSNSSAALAKLLNAPVILVIDTQGMTRGVAPLLLGFQRFEPQINIAGVILNKVGGVRHEGKLRAVVERYTDIPVLGAIQRDPILQIQERHLGLLPSNETGEAESIIQGIATKVAAQVDLDRVLAVAQTAPAPTLKVPELPPLPSSDVRLGLVRDAAFGFYYPGDIMALRQAGAEIVEINALHDPALPKIDGLFIGGGFPEVHKQALAANRSLRLAIKQAIADDLPVYAECGGLMYLCKGISWQGERAEMVGAIDAEVSMHDRPIGRGYICLEETDALPWPKANTDTGSIPRTLHAHEFHYSKLEKLNIPDDFAFKVLRGTGIMEKQDGIVLNNILATYAHQRDVKNNRWAHRFIEFIRRVKAAKQAKAQNG